MEAFIVTGASRGLGLALARLLADRGHRVAGVARRASLTLDNGPVIAIDADLTGADAGGAILRALAALPLAQCERVTLINNAGTVTPIALAGRYPDDEVGQALALNLVAPILACNAFLAATDPLPLGRRVLNISSGAAAKAYPGWGVYGAGKAGLDHFTRCVAAEQHGHPNPAQLVALYPGVVDTGMQDTIRATPAEGFPMRQRFVALKEEGQLTPPDTAAARIADYLASPAFGSDIIIDIRDL
ncbi:SDR family NAD(P)-dependent oxidoreductase [Paludibacterium paludis]|uniref:Short-chain dehydrogenase n=1 Tax=Paludibacterium paludis TaxID=1225769 RepID=A0A918P400_9NEIS|nr:SDR family NAD(P)-dependent oxidoreductase [Paludibacterium paludis]GGY17705.1 short-chain dehydrogenase [Paludibacterium paludis]